MDGTFSWLPFVEQTIAMARNVHKHRYRMGVGYKVQEDGTIIENYWEQIEEEEEEGKPKRRPYRIELVGVVCDAYLAVVRGIRYVCVYSLLIPKLSSKISSINSSICYICRRAIAIGRAVRVNSQLKSHKRFANAFPKYCQLVDHARLYCTNAVGGPPTVIFITSLVTTISTKENGQ